MSAVSTTVIVNYAFNRLMGKTQCIGVLKIALATLQAKRDNIACRINITDY